MRWYEYKMEVDDLHASDDLKAKLLALQANAAETPGAKSIAMPAPSPTPKKQKKASPLPRPALGPAGRLRGSLRGLPVRCRVCLRMERGHPAGRRLFLQLLCRRHQGSRPAGRCLLHGGHRKRHLRFCGQRYLLLQRRGRPPVSRHCRRRFPADLRRSGERCFCPHRRQRQDHLYCQPHAGDPGLRYRPCGTGCGPF